MMERTLEFVVHLGKSETYVDVMESQSGEQARFPFDCTLEKHPEFDLRIGNELYWWIQTWMEEMGLVEGEEDGE